MYSGNKDEINWYINDFFLDNHENIPGLNELNKHEDAEEILNQYKKGNNLNKNKFFIGSGFH